ncbi:MAG TPA: hypothetical protein VHY59_08490, partial [Chthoniobacterales bacterium]|nr:hypothetical protein [Chthoniobacterales bacterium]
VEVAVYSGDELICMGTIPECAAKLNILPATLYFYLMPSYERRLSRRPKGNPGRQRRVVRV